MLFWEGGLSRVRPSWLFPLRHNYGSLTAFSPAGLSLMRGCGFTAAELARCVPARRRLAGRDTGREERVSLDYRYCSAATSTDISVVYGSHTIWKTALKESLPTES